MGFISVKQTLRDVEVAVDVGFVHRFSFNRGSPSESSWAAIIYCCRQTAAILLRVPASHESAFLSQWRSSSASKKTIALLRAVIEAEGDLIDSIAPQTSRETALLEVIGVVTFIFRCTHDAVLWPQLKLWLVQQGGAVAMLKAATKTAAWFAMRLGNGHPEGPVPASSITLLTHGGAFRLFGQLCRSHSDKDALLSQPGIGEAVSDALGRYLTFMSRLSLTDRQNSEVLEGAVALSHSLLTVLSKIRPWLMPRLDLAHTLHPQLLRVWPSLMHALRLQPPLDPETSSMIRRSGMMSALRMLTEQPGGTWARHWACALDVMEQVVMAYADGSWDSKYGATETWSSLVLKCCRALVSAREL
jgi:hypothetical protein